MNELMTLWINSLINQSTNGLMNWLTRDTIYLIFILYIYIYTKTQTTSRKDTQIGALPKDTQANLIRGRAEPPSDFSSFPRIGTRFINTEVKGRFEEKLMYTYWDQTRASRAQRLTELHDGIIWQDYITNYITE